VANVVDTVDRFQRKHAVLSMPLAVVYKFFEDQGNYLAAVVTYYAFIAIFPLMLLASSILGFVLQNDPELQAELLDSALGQFPIIGDQLGRPEGIEGSTGAIVIGSLAALYGAVGLGQAIQNVSNTAWSVPRNSRPNPFRMRLRSLLLLLTAGVAVVGVVVVSAVVTNSEVLNELVGTDVRWVISLASILVVGTVLTLLLRFAAARDHSMLRAAPGAFAIAIMWQALQYVGAAYVSAVLVNTSAMNQTFGLVLGLIGIIYIAAVMAVLGIELNVVLERKLYPRALLTPFTDRVDLTDADRRAYIGHARAQRFKGFQTVDVSFDERADEASSNEAVGDPADETPDKAER
jgi:YihY family inner membrane protein